MAQAAVLVFAVLLVICTADCARITAHKGTTVTPARNFKPDIVELINNDPRVTWTAGHNPRVHDISEASFKGMLGAYRGMPTNALPVKKPSRRSNLAIPKDFDARKQWSHCPTIGHIRDQGHCGSCWAFGAAEALSDRFCVKFNESIDLSANDVLACCGAICGDGCDGGWPYRAWQYFVRRGIVSEKCEPYFDQDGCGHPGCSPGRPTPACSRSCVDGEAFPSSKHYAVNAYTVDSKAEHIQRDLLENGPMEVAFDVYEDFAYYKSGVYKHMYGENVGGHAVKLIGWGTSEEGVDYWLIANSWRKDWGENGYFRIIRGNNECGIEEEVTAGIPKHHSDAVAALDITSAVEDLFLADLQ